MISLSALPSDPVGEPRADEVACHPGEIRPRRCSAQRLGPATAALVRAHPPRGIVTSSCVGTQADSSAISTRRHVAVVEQAAVAVREGDGVHGREPSDLEQNGTSTSSTDCAVIMSPDLHGRADGRRDRPAPGKPSRTGASGLEIEKVRAVPKTLVVVESPAKAKTIEKYLAAITPSGLPMGTSVDSPKSKPAVRTPSATSSPSTSFPRTRSGTSGS